MTKRWYCDTTRRSDIVKRWYCDTTRRSDIVKRWYCDTTRRSDIGIVTQHDGQTWWPEILSRGARLPKGHQLISRGTQALTRFTTWKVFKRKVFHLIYFKRQGVLKQKTFAWGRRGREKVKNHCDTRRTLACQIYKTWSFSAYEKLSTSVLLRFGQEDISQKLVVTSLSQWLWESDLRK